MAWDSSQTMQMIGAYQGQAMNNMAYSNSISMMARPGGGGDRMMGGMMNAASSVGGPMLSAGMGLMGLDPMSMGLKAGMAAYGAGGGLMGGALAATGVGLPIAAGMAGLQHVGSQMYSGAQQQQALNQTLGGFNFQNAQGGRGFNRSDMSIMGGTMRAMTENFGPGGEITSMKELTTIAGKMNSMGLAQGVRDVQEFSKKFKETVTALKTMAKDLGTTLEGAMEFASAARGSGVFGMQNASRFASAARGTAAAGGLAMSEVTSMASIGSQISRSIGGLGSQGAMAGMRTIGQIGTAQQMGILSDQDVYNVTGLSGAEGRQAYAANSMQKAGSFLQSGRGRRLLASVAGKDGSLDSDAVQQLMGGGMGIGETMRRDNQMKTSVGRANFIRNEGRLRGAALQEFGAFLPGLQMQQWAQSKGIDINNMDDRSMLFAQRQLGMGRDEADQAMKMAQNLPRIMDEMKTRQSRDAYMQDYAQAKKGMGIEGIKQRLEHAQESVNNKLQKVGQDFFNTGSEMLDSWLTKLTGAYEQKFSVEAEKAYKSASMGTGSKTAMQEMNRYGGMKGSLGGIGGPGGISGFNAGSAPMEMTGSSILGLATGSTQSHALQYLMGGESDRSKMERAGYNMKGVSTNAQLTARLQQIGDISRAANEPVDEKYVALGKQGAAWMDAAYASGRVSGKSGEDRMNAFGSELMSKGTQAQKDAWKNASDPEKARIMAGMVSGRGIGEEGANFGIPELTGSMKGGAMSEYDRRMEAGKSFRGQDSGGLGGALRGGILGVIAGTAFTSRIAEKFIGRGKQDEALGAFLESREATDLVEGLRGPEADATKASIVKQISSLAKSTDDNDKAKVQGLQGLLAGKEYEAALAKYPDGNIPKEELQRISANTGTPVDQIKAAYETSGNIEARKRAENLRGMATSIGGQSKKRLEALSSAGIVKFEGGQATLQGASKMGTQAQSISARLLAASAAEVRASNLAASGTQEGLLAAREQLIGAQSLRAGVGDELTGATVEQKRKIASEMARAGLGDEARGIYGAAASQDRLTKLNRSKGDAGAAAAFLGLTMDADMAKAMKGATAEQKAKILASQAGVSGAAVGDLQSAIEAMGKGGAGMGKASQILSQLQGTTAFQEGMKKKQLDAAAAENPLQDAMNKNLDEISKKHDKQIEIMKIIGRNTGSAAAAIDALDKKDAEAAQPGQSSGGKA